LHNSVSSPLTSSRGHSGDALTRLKRVAHISKGKRNCNAKFPIALTLHGRHPMFRLHAFPIVILCSIIGFIAGSVAPADAQSTGSPNRTQAASPSKNAAAKQKQTKQGYVSTQTRMGCKMGGNCQR
jgi:hypothetical protein